VKIFSGHDGSGCAYYRVIQPLEELARHGHDVTLVSAVQDDGGPGVTIGQAAGNDVVVAQRWNNHAAMGSWRRMSQASKLVYETDDDVFSVDQVNWSAYCIYSRADVQDAVSFSARTASLVTVSTEPLAKVMREHSDNVVVLPNHIPAYVCDVERPRADRLVIGWGGGASHAQDVSLIARPVRRFLERNPGWDMHLKGVDYRPTIRHPRVRFSPWLHIVDDARAYYGSADFDIGLAPIYPSVFAASKSAIKALEYGALGIPVIASDCEAYRDYVLHGVTGFLVKRDHEWLGYMQELANDAGLRESMGAKARELARQHCIDNGYRLWEQAYAGLLR
jgi:glycosyltransferase involved in cell wall biosynthesis